MILGRTLPGNTIAKTFHCWVQLGNSYSFWNSTRSSKNTTQGRKGRRREERKEKGREKWMKSGKKEGVAEMGRKGRRKEEGGGKREIEKFLKPIINL